MVQLKALLASRAKIIDTGIVPITAMLLVVVINYFMDMQRDMQYGSVENSSHDTSRTHITEHDADLDASDGETPTKLYWEDGSEVWYLQALQQPEGVIIAANVTHPYSINTAAVFVKTKKELLQYTLSNYGVYGDLTVDPTSGVNETYKVTIFENQHQYPPSVFTDFDNGKIKIVSGPLSPNDHELQYPLYLMVDTSSYVVMATNDMSKATEFHPDLATFSKPCPP